MMSLFNWLKIAEVKSAALEVANYLETDAQYSREAAVADLISLAFKINDIEEDCTHAILKAKAAGQ